MEFDRELYQRTFSRVKASPETIQEVIDMTENRKPKKTVRKTLVAVAAVAMAVLTAMGANAATGGELFARIVSYTEYYDKDGGYVGEMMIEVDGSDAAGENGPEEFQIYQEGENGKALMVHIDENGNKISQEIDLDEMPSAQPPVLKLDGKEVEITGTELDREKGTITVQYTGADGKEGSAVLVLPEDCREFAGLTELLASRETITGKTQAGEEYQLSQRPAQALDRNGTLER